MAVYSLSTTQEEIGKEITKFILSFGGEISADEKTHDSGRRSIKAKLLIDKFSPKFHADIYPGEKCILSITLTPSTLIQAIIVAIILSFLFFLILVLPSLNSMILGSFKLSLKNIVIFCGLFISGLAFLKIIDALPKALREIEAAFCKIISKKFQVKLLSPIEARIFSLWFYISYHIFILIGLIIIFSRAFKIFLIVLLPYVFVILCHLYLREKAKRNFFLLWKANLIEINNLWIIPNIYLILFLGVLYLTNITVFIRAQKAPSSNPQYTLKQALSHLFFAPAFERKSGKIVQENEELIKRMALLNAGENVQNQKTQEKITKYLVAFVSALLLLPITLIFGIILKRYKEILKSVDYWRSITAEEHLLSIRPPPWIGANAEKNTEVKTITLLNFIGCIPINYVSLGIAIEGFSYSLFDKTIIFKESKVLFAWIPACSSLLIKCLNLRQEWVGVILAKVLIFCISLPILIMVLRRFVNILGAEWRRIKKIVLTLIHKSRIPKEIIKYTEYICRKNSLKMPKFKISGSKKIIVSANLSVFARRSVLTISKGALNRLDKNELKAVIVHEIGHIKQGLRKLSFARLISKLAMFPNQFLTVMFDFSGMELEADRFCLKATGDKKALKEAIIKASLLNTLETPGEKRITQFFKNIPNIYKFYKKIVIIDEFFFKDVLIGYTQPLVTRRLEEINKYETEEGASTQIIY